MQEISDRGKRTNILMSFTAELCDVDFMVAGRVRFTDARSIGV